MGCDLLLMVGTDYPYSNFLPSKGTVVQIDERPQVLGRRAPTVLGVTGSAHPTLKLLLDQVASKTNTRFWDKVTQERQKWDEMLDTQADPARSEDRIHPQTVARAVSDLAKPDAAQRFVSVHAAVYNTFNVQRHLISRRIHRQFRTAAHKSWSDATVAVA